MTRLFRLRIELRVTCHYQSPCDNQQVSGHRKEPSFERKCFRSDTNLYFQPVNFVRCKRIFYELQWLLQVLRFAGSCVVVEVFQNFHSCPGTMTKYSFIERNGHPPNFVAVVNVLALLRTVLYLQCTLLQLIVNRNEQYQYSNEGWRDGSIVKLELEETSKDIRIIDKVWESISFSKKHDKY